MHTIPPTPNQLGTLVAAARDGELTEPQREHLVGLPAATS
jgi:hypothetical protein